jgi:serine/threonine protein phosphatase PrpC
MNAIEPEYYRDYLNHHDLIVMVSDGAANLRTNGEDWILKTLKRVEMAGVEPFSEYLLELAKIETDGEINDDLTIMVLQIEDRRSSL